MYVIAAIVAGLVIWLLNYIVTGIKSPWELRCITFHRKSWSILGEMCSRHHVVWCCNKCNRLWRQDAPLQ